MSKLPTVYPRITLRVGLISWIYFLYSWQVAGTRDPPENLARVPGRRNTRNRHPYNCVSVDPTFAPAMISRATKS